MVLKLNVLFEELKIEAKHFAPLKAQKRCAKRAHCLKVIPRQ